MCCRVLQHCVAGVIVCSGCCSIALQCVAVKSGASVVECVAVWCIV